MMIMLLTGHDNSTMTIVKTYHCKEFWPTNLLLPHKSAYAGSEDKPSKKTGNTKDVGTCTRFQKRTMCYQKEESERSRKK